MYLSFDKIRPTPPRAVTTEWLSNSWETQENEIITKNFVFKILPLKYLCTVSNMNYMTHIRLSLRRNCSDIFESVENTWNHWFWTALSFSRRSHAIFLKSSIEKWKKSYSVIHVCIKMNSQENLVRNPCSPYE